jgi:hypothetical protein
MGKWFDRAEVFCLLIFVLIYIAAKIHFFTGYGSLSAGVYLEQHWLFWAAMALVVAIEIAIRRIRKAHQGTKSN